MWSLLSSTSLAPAGLTGFSWAALHLCLSCGMTRLWKFRYAPISLPDTLEGDLPPAVVFLWGEHCLEWALLESKHSHLRAHVVCAYVHTRVCVCVCAWCVRHIKPALGSREWGLELQDTELQGQAESHRRKAPWRGWRGGRVAGRPQQAACRINLTSPCFPRLSPRLRCFCHSVICVSYLFSGLFCCRKQICLESKFQDYRNSNNLVF